ncbi:MAG: hypothetical protein ABL994_06140, partial [Verrucomicrobiales bacterium]
MKKSLLFCLLLFATVSSSPLGLKAADPVGKSFRFPGGEVEAGKEAFTSLNCIQCHTVANVELADPKGNRRLELMLAKEARFVKSYGDLKDRSEAERQARQQHLHRDRAPAGRRREPAGCRG